MLSVILLVLFVAAEGIQVTPSPSSPPGPSPGYHDYHLMTHFLAELANNYSEFASLHSIGRSVGKKELWVLRLKSPSSPVLGAPHVKYVGNIHGNEPVGRELILYFAEYLLKNYATDNEVRWILDQTVIHLLPSMNPDGFEKSKEGDCHFGPGRANGNSVDLNRSFPDHFKENQVPVQPETIAIDHWMSQVTFSLSASFHGGAVVANYPYDSNPGTDSHTLLEGLMRNVSRGGSLWDLWNNLTAIEKDSLVPRPSIAPDDDVFRHLAQTYSNNHLTMHKGSTCHEDQRSFPGGIVNGADWYSFTGGMQDYNYVSQGCMELTLEISCCKYPQAHHLARLWNDNKRAMLELVKQAHMGVRGLVVDKVTSAYISRAVLHVAGRNVPFFSSKNGEFWRILLPGNYILVVEAKGYYTQNFPFTVENFNASYPTSTWLNIFLQPIDQMAASASSNTAEAITNSGSLRSLSCLLLCSLGLIFFIMSKDLLR